MTQVAQATRYDDYDPHSVENEPDWPEYVPAEEPPPEWVGWDYPDGYPGEDRGDYDLVVAGLGALG